MGFTVKANNKTGGGFEVPPAGSHPAVLVAIIDLGTHSEEYKNKDKPTRIVDVRKLFIAWELTAEPMSASKNNHVVGRTYTLGFSKKSALRALVEGWSGKQFADGEEFDVVKLLGRKCLINLSHTASGDRTYAKIESVAQVPKGLPVPEPQHKPTLWEIGQSMADLEAISTDWLPFIFGEKASDIAKRCHELSGKKSAGGADAEPAAVGAETNNDEFGF